jgi:hypothetical protein
MIVAMLAACGGGGGGETANPPEDHPPNVGAGRIRIESPVQDSLTTDRDSIYLSGTAFISSTYYRCCSGSATDTGVIVGWSNSAGGGGSVSQHVEYCSLGFGVPWVCQHTWGTRVSLAVGTNIIVVSAYDPVGNTGYDSVRVTRVPDTTPPAVSSTFPADNAANVAGNSYVSAAFSEPIDPASVLPDAITVMDQFGNLVPGTASAIQNYGIYIVRFAAASSFADNRTYTATLGAGVRDQSGNALASAHVWSFTTGAYFDLLPPAVTATIPEDGGACAFTDTLPTATFSEDIDPTTVNDDTFMLTDAVSMVPGTVSPLSANAFRFTPNAGLKFSTSYTATVTSGVRDIVGNSLPANYSWTFATVAPGTGTWQSISQDALGGLVGPSTVWTGSEMIVWGGRSDLPATSVGRGYRFNPTTNGWTQVSSVGAPTARSGHVSVWTGTEMIVWGGSRTEVVDPSAMIPVLQYFNLTDGARFNPITDTWTPMSDRGAPDSSASSVAVWTGSAMLVWNGLLGERYDPIADAWTPMAAPPEPILGARLVWTGERLLIWGASSFAAAGAGAAYDPLTNSWKTMSTTGAPARRTGYSVVWTGAEMIVWGGKADQNFAVNSGFAYDPMADTWRSLAACGASARAGHTAVWTGSEMIVWGGSEGNTGQAYNPTTNSWRQLAVVNAPSPRWGHSAEWTGTAMIIWGGSNQYATASYGSGALYSP